MTKPPEVGRKVHVTMSIGKLEHEGIVHSILGQQFVLADEKGYRTVFRNDNDWRYIYED